MTLATDIAQLVAQHDAEDASNLTRLTDAINLQTSLKTQLDEAVRADMADDKAYEAKITALTAELTDLRLYKELHPVTGGASGVEKDLPMLVGAGGGNKTRPELKEEVDRPYYGASDATKAAARILSNDADGIVTWFTIKPPAKWAVMASGAQDAWYKDLTSKIAAAQSKCKNVEIVPFDIGHEPEGDEGMTKAAHANWRLMHEHLAPLTPVDAGLEYWLCTTGWAQEFDKAMVTKGTNWTNLFPLQAAKKNFISGIAYDAPYQKYGQPLDGSAFNNGWTNPVTYIDALAARAVDLSKQCGHTIKTALGEWGEGDEAFTKDPTYMDLVLSTCNGHNFYMNVYFDSKLNSARSWALGEPGTKKFEYYKALIAKY